MIAWQIYCIECIIFMPSMAYEIAWDWNHSYCTHHVLTMWFYRVIQKDAHLLRDTRIMAYFRQCFPREMNITTSEELAHALASHPPYEVPTAKIKIMHLHCQVLLEHESLFSNLVWIYLYIYFRFPSCIFESISCVRYDNFWNRNYSGLHCGRIRLERFAWKTITLHYILIISM